MRQNYKAEKAICDKMIKSKNHLRQNYKRKLLHYK